MGKVKQHERKSTENSAGHYLSYDNPADLYGAYRDLVDASNRGEGDKCASDFVEVWQPLENKTVDEILDMIEGGKLALEEMDEKNPIHKIDFTELRNQKMALLTLLQTKVLNETLDGHLHGILHLIDSIQDYAVDELGWDENLVFDFEEEENRED